MWPLRCSGIGYYCVSLGWEELGRTVGWSLMEAVSSPLGNSTQFLALRGWSPSIKAAFLHGTRLGGSCTCKANALWVQGLLWGTGGRGEHWVCTYSSWSIGPKVLEDTRVEYDAPSPPLPGLLIYNLFVTVLASSSCLYIIPIKDLDSASRHSFHYAGLASS